MQMSRLLERVQIVEGFKAVDLQAAANNGDYVSLENYGGVLILFHSAVGTAGDDPTLTVQQAQDVAGAGVKALNFTRIDRKQAATDLSGTGQWTKTTQAAANTYTEATAAEQDLLWAVDIQADELDVDNGFDCVRATVADIGANAQLGMLLYLLYDPRYPTAPENMLSAIVD